MKPLHVLDHSLPSLDGYAIRSGHIVNFQAGMGFTPVVVTSSQQEDSNGAVDVIEGIKHYRSVNYKESSIPFYRELKRIKRMAGKIDEVVSKENPDLIHAHSPCLWGAAAARVAKRRSLPFVYEIRGFWEDAAVDRGFTTETSLRYRFTRWLETKVAKSANVVTTIAEHMREDLIERGIAAEKIVMVPNGVDSERFSETTYDQQLAEELNVNERNCVGYIGSLFVWEGVEDFVRSAPRIVAGNPNTLLIIVGGGECADAIRDLIDELGVGDHVKYIGRVPHDQVKRYYSIMDILVYPRKHTRHTETVTPLKPLEAMSMGKAIVSSDVGGLAELIADGTGLTFQSGNPDDFAAKIIELLQAEDRRKEMGKRAREHMIQNRDWKKLITTYKQVYDQAQRV